MKTFIKIHLITIIVLFTTKGVDISTAGNTIYSNPYSQVILQVSLVNKAILRILLDPTEFALPIINESGNSTLNGNDGDNEFLSFGTMVLKFQSKIM